MLLRCEACRQTYRSKAYQADRALDCPKCRQALNLVDLESPQNARGAALPPVAKAAALDPARRLGRFVLVHELGRGGMGIVHQAWDTSLGRWVAIKLLRMEGTDEQVVERFRQEASVVASLDHPNIAPVFDVMRLEDRYAIVMKYIEGKSLHEIFVGDERKSMPIEDIVRYARDASLGLGYAHSRGFVHRDIKPGNLMLDREGRVYVLDFGLAKVLTRSEALTNLGEMMGTPAYMSPEQAMGLARDVDSRSDVFSMGSTLWTLLTGKRPFPGNNDVEVARSILRNPTPSARTEREDVSKELDLVLRKAMEKDREGRYPTAVELAAALNDCLVELEDRREALAKHEPISKPGFSVTVLMIEDEPDVVSLVKKVMEKDGVKLIHIADGLAAMEEVEKIEPSIVLLDINLPGLSGWEVLHRMRSLPSYVHIPIIMVSSEVGEENVVRGFQLGADDYIEKPFSLEILRARMRYQLSRRKE